MKICFTIIVECDLDLANFTNIKTKTLYRWYLNVFLQYEERKTFHNLKGFFVKKIKHTV